MSSRLDRNLENYIGKGDALSKRLENNAVAQAILHSSKAPYLMGISCLLLVALIPIIVGVCIEGGTCTTADMLMGTDVCTGHPEEKPVLTDGERCPIKCDRKGKDGMELYEPTLECVNGELLDSSTGTKSKELCYEIAREKTVEDFANANVVQVIASGSMCALPPNGNVYMCQQGQYIPMNKVCTVSCLKPTIDSIPTIATLTCDMKTLNLVPDPDLVECMVPVLYDKWLAEQRARPCDSNLVCGGNGIASRNATSLLCDCDCEYGYSGRNCETVLRECFLPEISNAAKPLCEEGFTTYVTGQYCTLKCQQDYFPAPQKLECIGKELKPSRFECRGGPMGPGVCPVAVSACVGIWVFGVCVIVCLERFRNWVAFSYNIKVFSMDVVAEEVTTHQDLRGTGGRVGNGNGNANKTANIAFEKQGISVIRPTQSSADHARGYRERYTMYKTDPVTGRVRVVSAEEEMEINDMEMREIDPVTGRTRREKSEREMQMEDAMKRQKLEEIGRLKVRTVLGEDIAIEDSSFHNAYEAMLEEDAEMEQEAARLALTDYSTSPLVDGGRDTTSAVGQEDSMLAIKNEVEMIAEEELAKEKGTAFGPHGEINVKALQAPTDQRYGVDFTGRPDYARQQGNSMGFFTPEDAPEVPTLQKQAEWVERWNLVENVVAQHRGMEMAVTDTLNKYEHAWKVELNTEKLKQQIITLQRAKLMADETGNWELSKRCRHSAQMAAEKKEKADTERDIWIEKLKTTIESKNPDDIDKIIESTRTLNEMYPALFGRWHMVAREVSAKERRKMGWVQSHNEVESKRKAGIMGDYRIGSAEVIQAVIDGDANTVRAGLNAHVPINTRCPKTGLCLIHFGVQHFNPEVLKLLITKKANTTILTRDGKSIWDLSSGRSRGFLGKNGLQVPENANWEKPQLQQFKFGDQAKQLFTYKTNEQDLDQIIDGEEEATPEEIQSGEEPPDNPGGESPDNPGGAPAPSDDAANTAAENPTSKEGNEFPKKKKRTSTGSTEIVDTKRPRNFIDKQGNEIAYDPLKHGRKKKSLLDSSSSEEEEEEESEGESVFDPKSKQLRRVSADFVPFAEPIKERKNQEDAKTEDNNPLNIEPAPHAGTYNPVT